MNRRLISAAAIIVALVLIGVCYRFADYDQTKFLLAFFSGNWSAPSNFETIGRLEFAITGIFAILINYAPLIAAAALVYSYLRPLAIAEERVNIVLLKEALDVSEEATKLALAEEFSADKATIDKINKAFARGSQMAKQHIEAAFGAHGLKIFEKSLTNQLK